MINDKLFQIIEELTEKKEKLEVILKEKQEYHLGIKKVLEGDSDIKLYLNRINISKPDLKVFVEMTKLNIIARKINNFEFDQYKEKIIVFNKLKDSFYSEYRNLLEEYDNISKKLEAYEYVFDLNFPIDDEEVLDEVISKYGEYIGLLEFILNGNVSFYTNTKEKEKQLTDKLDELDLSDDIKEMILVINDIINSSQISSIKKEQIESILSMNADELKEYFNECLFIGDDNVLFGVLKGLIDNIDNKNSIGIIKAINDRYISNQKEEYKDNIVERPIILNLVKPNGKGYYIDDDINKIESVSLAKRVKKQFSELEAGNLSGKPIKYYDVRGLWEKKDYKIRTTYKVLANNIVVIINCYMKGTNEAAKTKSRISATEFQINLYEALANGDKTQIERLTSHYARQSGVSKDEIEIYINNFNSVVDEFKRGSK